ncbi:methyltransferase domain-containing protein [Acinetobacter sp. SwsAc6]|uniref:SAM-dependent methyltransferase n=1 Tax=Acinetobacter sp. SwsAc6 TaxID=2749439 RepID=UPI0015BCA97C|nr:class I SAM-dependent methyltransferase [Acinetobacter sp. SwsAc6]NWK73346.1 methyltransferase domain-containing protein [Acinetobacter sp. SwsAc6]
MKWLHSIKQYIPRHKYAIDAKFLGDDALLAWSNLGYWQAVDDPYPQACQALADRLAQSLKLQANDQVLDLGCGQGASILHWHTQYQVASIKAVELQEACVQRIQNLLNSKHIPTSNIEIFADSFLNLNSIFPKKCFDVVMCIDAAYHSNLNSFLLSTTSVLNSKGRLGFHYLIVDEKFLNLNAMQQLRYRALLKAADVDIRKLPTANSLQENLKQFEFKNVQIENISMQVFSGFAQYAHHVLNSNMTAQGLAQFKIQMTAKLCRTLFEEGLVHYVQVSASKDV